MEGRKGEGDGGRDGGRERMMEGERREGIQTDSEMYI